MKRDFSEELDKNEYNPFEFVNVTAQVARMINDQARTDGTELKTKVTTEALKKVLDGRVVVIRESENA
ncbi:MAG: hypothetical protein A2293_09000 [Elusimicrobia bacterium RIFOXYB2_FULL_49_7]|nr:MAG: hypothetical protein A2293_09000 [Elusimicrobia bacterium RIFOXYB2_FULL_49_7]